MFVAWTAAAVARAGARRAARWPPLGSARRRRQRGRRPRPSPSRRSSSRSRSGCCSATSTCSSRSLYGLSSSACSRRPRPRSIVRPAGGGIAVATLAKLHPGSLGLWLLVRAAGERGAAGVHRRRGGRRWSRSSAVSVLVGGTQPWIDYATVVRAGSGADLVDPRNAGPAAQIALLARRRRGGAGGPRPDPPDPGHAHRPRRDRVAARRGRRPGREPRVGRGRVARRAAGDLVPLPVGADPVRDRRGAPIRERRAAARRVRWTVVVAGVVAAAAIAWLPLIYAAIGLVLLAARQSRPLPSPVRVPDARRSAARA